MKLRVLLVLALLLFSFAAQAKLNDKNVLLIQGMNRTGIVNPPPIEELPGIADEYWKEYWLANAEGVFYWPSSERIEGGIKDMIREQIKAIEAEGTCSEGCVVVTHSTGDLILRYALSRLTQWGVDPNKFSVALALDFGGAGGGTEAADVIYDVAEGIGLVNDIKKWVFKKLLGVDEITTENLGVFADLRPVVARNIAKENGPVPRLRCVGTGKLAGMQALSSFFIKGPDDGAVPLHSACGASHNSDEYKSCSRSRRIDGKEKAINAPTSLLFNHYALLASKKAHHYDTINDRQRGDYLTPMIDEIEIAGFNIKFPTTCGKRVWQKHDRCRIRNNRKSMSRAVYDVLNN